MLRRDEVQNHNTRQSCWVVISGHAYDVTDFLDSHPGGPSSILRLAGRDATSEYDPIHPPGTIEKHLPQDKHLGPVEGDEPSPEPEVVERANEEGRGAPLSTLQNLDDFEEAASKVLSRKAWVYYHSASETMSSKSSNRQDWSKVLLRPRVLRNVGRVSCRTTIMGHSSALPFFIAPAASARLGHPDGELCLARGAARFDIPYCSSTYSSVSHAELAQCLKDENQGGALLFQLYVPIEKEGAKKLIAEARRLGFKALVVTVDSAVIGKRDEDDRYKAELDYNAGVEMPRTPRIAGAVPIHRGAHSSTFDWNDLTWIRQTWGDAGPVILKGIMTAEDAALAAQSGVNGIYLSNHGGRQLDYTQSSVRTLLEIRKFYPELLDTLEIYVDGGVSRGTDVLKALCLGARGVGVGRPFMYALSAYGTDGVCRAIQLLSDEIETSLRLLGATDLNQLDEFYVNPSMLELELPPQIRRERSQKTSKI